MSQLWAHVLIVHALCSHNWFKRLSSKIQDKVSHMKSLHMTSAPSAKFEWFYPPFPSRKSELQWPFTWIHVNPSVPHNHRAPFHEIQTPFRIFFALALAQSVEGMFLIRDAPALSDPLTKSRKVFGIKITHQNMTQYHAGTAYESTWMLEI